MLSARRQENPNLQTVETPPLERCGCSTLNRWRSGSSISTSTNSWQAAAPPCRSTGKPSTPSKRWASKSTLRSEEHTSELQSRLHLVCRLLLEKKKNRSHTHA